MLPRSMSRPPLAHPASSPVATVSCLGALPSAPAYAANPVTPGNYNGSASTSARRPASPR